MTANTMLLLVGTILPGAGLAIWAGIGYLQGIQSKQKARAEKVGDDGIYAMKQRRMPWMVSGFIPENEIVAVYRAVEKHGKDEMTGAEVLLTGNRYAQLHIHGGPADTSREAVDSLVGAISALYNIPTLTVRRQGSRVPTEQNFEQFIIPETVS